MLILPLSSSNLHAQVANPVEVLSEGDNYFLKVNLRDSRVKLRTVLANNDIGGYQTLSGIKSRFENQQYAQWAIVNGDVFGSGCPANVNCAQGLTYIDGQRKDNWTAYGSTWMIRGNIGFDSSKNGEINVGDAQSKRYMIIAGGPRILINGGTPTCNPEYDPSRNKTRFPVSGEEFDTDVRYWCTDTRPITITGLSADGSYLYMGISTGGKSVTTLAQWLKDRGAYQLLRFDSGSSTGMYYNSQFIGGTGSKPIVNALVLMVENAPPPSGWDQTFYSNSSLNSTCGSRLETDVYVFRDSQGGWSTPNGCPNTESAWSVRMERSDAYFDGGCYEFGLFYDDAARLYVDDMSRPVVDGWDATQHYESKCLNRGNHKLRLEYKNNVGRAIVQMWWRGPGALPTNTQTPDPSQWWVQYWGNQTQWSDAVGSRNEGTGFIDRNLGIDGPGFGIPNDHFSMRFERSPYFDCGIYRFHVISDDGSRLAIDGINRPNFDNWTSGVPDTSGDIYLQQGIHALKVDYFENGGAARVYLDWTVLSRCGDANKDSIIDGIDYVTWSNHYNRATSNGASDGDFNLDGRTDGIDYVIWLNNYNK